METAGLPFVVHRDDGSTFIAVDNPVLGPMPPLPEYCDHEGKTDDKRKAAWVDTVWDRDYRARLTEHARLTMLERYYRGLHFKSDQDNRRLEVTNVCFSNTEVARSVLLSRPLRPRLRALSPMNEEKVRKVREFGRWWMNRAETDQVRYVATGTKCKFGYAILMIVVSPDTGMPYVIDWSPFDWYPDSAARRLMDCERFFFAGPIATRRLRQMFPARADDIKADNYVSPSYDVMVHADQGFYGDLIPRATNVPYVTAPESSVPGNPPTSGTTTLVPGDAFQRDHGSDTTWFSQFITRDSTLRRRVTYGKTIPPGASELDAYPDTHTDFVPSSPSGWRILFLVPGTVLHEEPVDECFGGLPFEVDYRYQHDHRISGIGEIDQIVSMQKAYNHRKNALNHANDLASIPVVSTDDPKVEGELKNGVERGQVILHSRGRNAEFMQYRGPDAPQFNQLAVERRDIEIVSGIHEALQGIKPEGVEAGVALERLQTASAIRLQSSMPASMRVWANLLTKAVKTARRKLKSPYSFHASDGELMSVSGDDLDGEYFFEVLEEDTDLDAQAKKEEKVLTLFQMGLIAPDMALELIEFPDWKRVATRTMEWQLQVKQAEAMARIEAEAQAGTKGGKAGPPRSKEGGA